jgi:argininosuccinate lyase
VAFTDASPAARCRACGADQPARAREERPAADRYCTVCGTPECDDAALDRLQDQQQDTKRLYGNRLVSPTPEVVAFMAGWDVAGKGAADQSLVPFDLWVNRAHAHMLVGCSILTAEEGRAILDGLAEIERLYLLGHFVVTPALEDVHTNIETYLSANLGINAALSLHTARSRNDQVVTDMRLWMRERVLNLARLCLDCMDALTTMARQHLSSVMAGYTHHQHATLSTFGHHLAAYAEALRRVVQRLNFWYETFNYSPLGCVTGFSTTFVIDRQRTAELLGCYGPEPNSLDPITSRWEPEAELAQICAVLLAHLSSMAQTLILLSTPEFGVLKLHPRFCSGSSIMPQKVNPDALEVIKAKAAEVTGRLGALLSLGQANLTGYNRDHQWSKYLIMEACLETLPAVSVMTRIIRHSCRPLAVNPWLDRPVGIDTARLHAMARSGFTGVTEFMEQLVARTGLEFRRLKRVMEHAVALSLQQGEPDRVTHAAMSQALEEEGLRLGVDAAMVHRLQEPTSILQAKQVMGGPGPEAMAAGLSPLEAFVASRRQVWQERDEKLHACYNRCRQIEM